MNKPIFLISSLMASICLLGTASTGNAQETTPPAQSKAKAMFAGPLMVHASFDTREKN